MNKISTFSHTSYLWASPLMNLEPTKNFLASLQLQAADTWFSSTITATFHYIITTIPPIINTISSSFTAILPTYVNLLIRSRLPVLISLCLYITCRPTAHNNHPLVSVNLLNIYNAPSITSILHASSVFTSSSSPPPPSPSS